MFSRTLVSEDESSRGKSWLKEFMTTKLALREILEGIAKTEDKDKHSQEEQNNDP